MMDRNEQFRCRVRNAMDIRKLSAREIADQAGIDPNRLTAMLAEEGYLLWFEMESVTRVLDEGEQSECG